MPTPIRRILALAAAFSLTLAAALLLQNADRILPAERPISLAQESQTLASLSIFGRVYTLDLSIAEELTAHLAGAADTALSLLPSLLRQDWMGD